VRGEELKRKHHNLLVWQEAMELVQEIYTATSRFPKFLSIARGSLSELETQILIGDKLGYLSEKNNLLERVDKVFRLLGGLMRSLKKEEDKK